MTIRYNFDQIIDRREYNSMKWCAYDAEVLPMWVADMDFVSPQPVIDALLRRVEHGIFGYPDGLHGLSEEKNSFRQLLVDRMASLYSWQIQPEDIIFLPGVVDAFNLACHAFVKPEEAVLVQTPVYPPMLIAAETTGVIHQEMELTRCQDGSYIIDWNKFEASITPQTRLFILCNPHNPVGKVFNIEELNRIAEICLRNGILICSDEIHCDLVYIGSKHVPIANLAPEVAQRSITLIAPSKTYNLPGLQCSIAIIQNRELRSRYLNARKGLVPWINLLGLIAAQAAYEQGQGWLDQVLVYLENNRNFLKNFIYNEIPEIQMGMPEGTYLAWLDCRSAIVDENPYTFFLKRGKIALNDGDTFGRGGQGFVRLNFGCPRSTLENGLQRIKNALASR